MSRRLSVFCVMRCEAILVPQSLTTRSGVPKLRTDPGAGAWILVVGGSVLGRFDVTHQTPFFFCCILEDLDTTYYFHTYVSRKTDQKNHYRRRSE